METFSLGSTGFSQVGRDDYHEKQQIECRVLMAHLEKKFGRRIKASGGRLVWKSHAHDLGTYHEMEFHIQDYLYEKKEQQVLDLVSAMESFDWDNVDLIAEMDAIWKQKPTAVEQRIERSNELDDMARQLEEAGAVVILPPQAHEDLEKPEELIQQAHDNLKKEDSFRNIDVEDLNMSELEDSIVPACCIYGCMVEPDGYCEHGNPSVLINAGMI